MIVAYTHALTHTYTHSHIHTHIHTQIVLLINKIIIINKSSENNLKENRIKYKIKDIRCIQIYTRM